MPLGDRHDFLTYQPFVMIINYLKSKISKQNRIADGEYFANEN